MGWKRCDHRWGSGCETTMDQGYGDAHRCSLRCDHKRHKHICQCGGTIEYGVGVFYCPGCGWLPPVNSEVRRGDTCVKCDREMAFNGYVSRRRPAPGCR